MEEELVERLEKAVEKLEMLGDVERKVYVLLDGKPCDGYFVCGVYTTKEKLVKYIDKNTEFSAWIDKNGEIQTSGGYFRIIPMNADENYDDKIYI